MLRFLLVFCISLTVTYSVSAQQDITKKDHSKGNGIIKPLILEIPEDEFFVVSIHKLDSINGEFEATVYLTLNSVGCNDPRIASKLSVGDSLFPLLNENSQKLRANETHGYATGGPFQFIQFTQGRYQLTSFICSDRKDGEGRVYGVWQGEFEIKGGHDWDTSWYPFDSQILHIEFETPLAVDSLEFRVKRNDFKKKSYENLNVFLKYWRVNSIKRRTYNFDYDSCFGYECPKSNKNSRVNCAGAMADITLTLEQKEAACVQTYSRYSLEIEINRKQQTFLTLFVLVLSLGPIGLLIAAFKIHHERIQRNQTAIGSIALFITSYFGYVTQVGTVPVVSFYSIMSAIYVILIIFYFAVTAPKLNKEK